MLLALFLLCLLALAYIYAGYPLLLWLVTRRNRRPPQRESPPPASCAVVIAAHNEASGIARKIDQILAGDNGRLVHRIVVVSDGSTDATARILRAQPENRVTLIELDRRLGKPACLNHARPCVHEPFVVFMDARQDVPDGVIRALLENMADPSIGVVSGELVFKPLQPGAREQSPTPQGMGAYWHYEKWIRKKEAQWRSIPGATGACYAIRRSLWRDIPPETLLDDVAIPMLAIQAGYRCIFEERAVIYDHPSRRTAEEFRRKRRTVAGNAQLPRLFPSFLSPRKNPIWFEYLSHKILRLLSPLFLIGLIVSALALLSAHPATLAAILALTIAYLAALFIQARTARSHPIIAIPRMFLLLNLVTLLGLLDGLLGRYRVTWDRAYTPAPPS